MLLAVLRRLLSLFSRARRSAPHPEEADDDLPLSPLSMTLLLGRAFGEADVDE